MARITRIRCGDLFLFNCTGIVREWCQKIAKTSILPPNQPPNCPLQIPQARQLLVENAHGRGQAVGGARGARNTLHGGVIGVLRGAGRLLQMKGCSGVPKGKMCPCVPVFERAPVKLGLALTPASRLSPYTGVSFESASASCSRS